MENTITLPYLVKLTSEMKVKVCLIEKLVNLAKADGFAPPDWDEFVNMYDKSMVDLIEFKNNMETLNKLQISLQNLRSSHNY